jgi:DNA-binding beta-propeller fold protein YncE
MTVSSPDESGVALIVGDEGAVPAGSLVHAVNNSKDTVALRVLEGLETALLGWVSPANAQSGLPEVCGKVFHACVLADNNGSFELSVAAAEDEEIIVEILDPATGARISEQFRHSVPANVKFFARPINDLGFLGNSVTGDHNLYVLMPHLVDGGTKGLVTVVNLDTWERTQVDFDGPNPTKIAVQTETRLAAVLDQEGEFVAKVDLTANNFNSPPKTAVTAPRDVILNTGGNVALVATAESTDSGTAVDARFIRSFNFVTGVEGGPIRISSLQTLVAGATNLETKALDLRSFTDGSIFFDMAAFVGTYDIAGTPTAVLGLFDAGSMLLVGTIVLPPGTIPEDVALLRTSDRIVVTDSGNNKILIFDFSYLGGIATITSAGAVSDPEGFVQSPRDIVLVPDQPFALITAKNGTDDHPDTVLTVNLSSAIVVDINPVGLNPSGAIIDPFDQLLYVSTFKSHTVTFLGAPELLP